MPLDKQNGSIDVIINASDREYLATYIPQSKDYERQVGFESIIPAVYRSFKENYKIVFEFKDTAYSLYKYDGNEINYIDLSINNMADNVKEEFIKRVIFGTSNANIDKKYDSYFTRYTFNDENKCLYNKLKDSKKSYHEKLGIYYEGEENGATLAPNANKTEKRIITYQEI